MIFNIKEIGQLGLVVKDLNKSMKMYWEEFGIGPWKIWDFFPPFLKEATFRGKPAKQKFIIAETTIGNMYFELIQHLEGETVYKEFLDKGREGLQHVSIYTNDIEPVVERFTAAGMPVIQSGKIEKDSYYYFDTEPKLGIMIEAQTNYGLAPHRVYPSSE